jgi:hypothetical protein
MIETLDGDYGDDSPNNSHRIEKVMKDWLMVNRLMRAGFSFSAQTRLPDWHTRVYPLAPHVGTLPVVVAMEQNSILTPRKV